MHTLPKPGSALRLAGLILTAAVITAVMVRAATEFMLDLQVFQDAGRALLAGADLYSEGFPTRSGFRFIYPPFGAVVFLPLAPLGATVAQLAWTAATVVAVWAILAMAASRLQLQGARTLALALTGAASCSAWPPASRSPRPRSAFCSSSVETGRPWHGRLGQSRPRSASGTSSARPSPGISGPPSSSSPNGAAHETSSPTRP